MSEVVAKLSQAELLKRKREARKAKILSNSNSRLEQITSSQTAPNPELDDEKDFTTEVASLPSLDAQKVDEDAGNECGNDGGDDAKEEKPKHEAHNAIPVSTSSKSSGTPLFAVADVELPSIDPLSSYEDLSSVAPSDQPSLQFSDALSWAHAFILSLSIILAIGNWVLFHTHDMFELGTLAEDIFHKKICRHLYWMAYNPMHEDLGASSVISFLGYTTPAWQFFLTLEVALLSARFYSIQSTKETAPFSIPEAAKPFMVQFGFDPNFYEKLISSVYGYYDMYDTMMRDMYLVLAIIGSVISAAVVAHSFGYCH